MIDLSGKIINNTYIIKSLINESEFIQRWEANAIFSPNTFFFDLIKDKDLSARIHRNKSILSEKLTQLQGIRNAYLLKTVEFGMFDDLFFSVQQKVTGKPLSELDLIDLDFTEDCVVKMMNKLGLCLLSFEWRGLTHNLLSENSIWIPDNHDNMGIFYISDSFLYYQFLYSEFPIEKHFISSPYCLCRSLYEDGKCQPGTKNDLYSFGHIFYKLITGINPLDTKSAGESQEQQKIIGPDLEIIENEKIRDFISRFFDDQRMYKSIEIMYEDFEKVFLNELSNKNLEEKRGNSSVRESIQLESVETFMDYTDEIIEERDQLEVVEDVELLPLPEDELTDESATEEIVLDSQKDSKNIVSNVVKTVFGFFSRFRNKNHSKKNKKKSEDSGPLISSGNEKIEHLSGDLKHSDTDGDPNRLGKLFRDLSSHFVDVDKKRSTNSTIDIEEYNKHNVLIPRKNFFDSHPDEPISLGNRNNSSSITEYREYPRSTDETESSPMLSYLLEESNFINREFNDMAQQTESISSDDLNTIIPRMPQEANGLAGEDSNEGNEDLEVKLSEPQIEQEQLQASIEEINNITEDKTLVEELVSMKRKNMWSALWDFIKKFFKFFK